MFVYKDEVCFCADCQLPSVCVYLCLMFYGLFLFGLWKIQSSFNDVQDKCFIFRIFKNRRLSTVLKRYDPESSSHLLLQQLGERGTVSRGLFNSKGITVDKNSKNATVITVKSEISEEKPYKVAIVAELSPFIH